MHTFFHSILRTVPTLRRNRHSVTDLYISKYITNQLEITYLISSYNYSRSTKTFIKQSKFHILTTI